MALLNTWASQQDPNSLSPLDRALNNYIQKGDAPLAYLMRGDAKGLLQDLNTPKPVNMTQDMTNAALNFNPIMGLLGTTAYHGSPYLFDKFDIKKVGTGEGAQVYGHGMYFAENPEVAKQYKDALKFNNDLKITTNGDLLTKKALEMSNMDTSKAVDILKSGSLENVKMPETFAKYMVESIKGKMQNPEGTLYKVDIPDKSIPKMLDWFKPLSEQTDEVKKALSNLPHRSKDWTFKDTLETLNAASHTKDIPGMNPTGQEIYSMIGRGMMTGNKAEGQRYASDLLSKQGISGIKYLDSGSRATGGTSNYVVFDPSEVKILEKGLLK